VVERECLLKEDKTYNWLMTSDADKPLRQHRQQRGRRRQRRVTGCQRLAANWRERRRMSQLNAAFEALRSHVPVFAYERRPSRCDTLRLAARYIAVMTELLASVGQTLTTADTDTISSSLLSSITRCALLTS